MHRCLLLLVALFLATSCISVSALTSINQHHDLIKRSSPSAPPSVSKRRRGRHYYQRGADAVPMFEPVHPEQYRRGLIYYQQFRFLVGLIIAIAIPSFISFMFASGTLSPIWHNSLLIGNVVCFVIGVRLAKRSVEAIIHVGAPDPVVLPIPIVLRPKYFRLKNRKPQSTTEGRRDTGSDLRNPDLNPTQLFTSSPETQNYLRQGDANDHRDSGLLQSQIGVTKFGPPEQGPGRLSKRGVDDNNEQNRRKFSSKALQIDSDKYHIEVRIRLPGRDLQAGDGQKQLGVEGKEQKKKGDDDRTPEPHESVFNHIDFHLDEATKYELHNIPSELSDAYPRPSDLSMSRGFVVSHLDSIAQIDGNN